MKKDSSTNVYIFTSGLLFRRIEERKKIINVGVGA